jgi:hypothetical protein
MIESVPFTSLCPKCKHAQSQSGFSRAELRRLFDRGHPIEAYCVVCDDFWAISVRERLELAKVVAADIARTNLSLGGQPRSLE